MRKAIVLSVCVCSFFFSLSANEKKYSKISNKEVLLTHKRSGTNMTIGLIQSIVRKPVLRFVDGQPSFEGAIEGINRLNLKLDKSERHLYRSHSVNDYIRKLSPSHNKLILVLRNFKECILRNKWITINDLYNSMISNSNRNAMSMYVNNLTFFHEWPVEETKLLILYEDLIADPVKETKKILSFLGYPDRVLRSVTRKRVDLILKQVYESYVDQHGINKTSGGKKEIFHSRFASKGELKKLDKLVKKRHPILWEKYLSRYETH